MPVSWDEFHGLCKGLAEAIWPWRPEIILPVGRGGYYPGTLLAHMLQTEVYPVRLSRRVNDVIVHVSPRWLVEPPPAIEGRRVLIVDEMCSTGQTISLVQRRVTAGGAAAARAATLFAHSSGAHVPDYIGVITDDLVLNPWDREIIIDGAFEFHPEYAAALAQQGRETEPSFLSAAAARPPAKRLD